MSLPAARLMAVSMLSLGMFCALAFRIAVRSLELLSGSGPPSLTAIVMVLASLGKTFDILSHRFSLAARRYSNARPIGGENVGCPPPRSQTTNSEFLRIACATPDLRRGLPPFRIDQNPIHDPECAPPSAPCPDQAPHPGAPILHFCVSYSGYGVQTWSHPGAASLNIKT